MEFSRSFLFFFYLVAKHLLLLTIDGLDCVRFLLMTGQNHSHVTDGRAFSDKVATVARVDVGPRGRTNMSS